jgi:hypothetical protein
MNRTLRRWDDQVFTPENVFTALALVAAIGAAAASRNLLKSGWRATTGTEPPISPESDDATWVQALTWGVITGAIIGIVRVLSRQGAASLHRWWK